MVELGWPAYCGTNRVCYGFIWFVILNTSPITYRIFTNENLLLSKVQGAVTFQNIVSNIYNLRADPNYSQGMNSFYDLTLCSNIDGDLNKLSEFGDLINDDMAIKNKCKTAILIPDDNQIIFRLVQGMVLMSSKSNIEHAFFKKENRHLAYQFLNCSQQIIVEIEK